MSEVSTPYFLDPAGKPPRHALKILDTSVIIDGRIADISETGFVEAPSSSRNLFWKSCSIGRFL